MVLVDCPGELLEADVAGNLSGAAGEQRTAVEDQDGEPGAVGGNALNGFVCHVETPTDVELLQNRLKVKHWCWVYS